MTRLELIAQINSNRVEAQELATESRRLVEEVITTGEEIPEDTFWEMCNDLRTEIDRVQKRGLTAKSGIHNFFYHLEYVNSTMINFVLTYEKYVHTIHRDMDIWKNATEYEFFSDDGWYDFTDFLPLQGREVYEHVLNETSDHTVYHDRHEEYILSGLKDKLMLFLA